MVGLYVIIVKRKIKRTVRLRLPLLLVLHQPTSKESEFYTIIHYYTTSRRP